MAPIARLMIVLAAATVVACGPGTGDTGSQPAASDAADAPAQAGESPAPSVPDTIDPANFAARVDNPWFPLTPGTTLTYKGTIDGEPAVDVFTITRATKVVDGVTCVVVRDTLKVNGKLAEQTEDWYAQDLQGNVWYFGEVTKEFNEKGKVISTDGTWQAGVDGARPGIFMSARPQIGQSFAQESYPGQAEDHFVVLLESTPVKVHAGSFRDALLTAEWTPLEPAVLEQKYYVRGIGEVKATSVAGEHAGMQLTSIKKP